MWKLRELWKAADRTENSLFDVIIDGMNYTPARPAYEDMRDGILAAAKTQAEDCIVWDAFARFGIGVGADGVESCSIFSCRISSLTESFAVPSACTGGTTNTAPTVSIGSPATGASFVQGTSISFSGTATDAQDGAMSGQLVWTSNLDGQIGTGSSFSNAGLRVGSHTVTATVTDSGGLGGSASVTFTITAPPGEDPAITLTATPRKVKGVNQVDLAWTGATGNVNIYRNDALFRANQSGTSYTDNTGTKGGATYTYRVCNAGTSVCSSTVTVVF
jgi:hypothetical protein